MGNYPPSSAHRKKLRKSKRSSTGSRGSSSSSDTTITTNESNNSPLYEKFLQNQPIPDDAPPDIKLIRQYLYWKDSQNFEGMESISDRRCTFYFTDAESEMTAREFNQAVKDTAASFPNLHFFWRWMTVSGFDAATNCTVVEVKDYYGIGKHDGKPYAFGPYEAIPATGKTIQDEKIRMRFFVRDGKIIKVVIDAYGELVGPAGFYHKIGGVIPGLGSCEFGL